MRAHVGVENNLWGFILSFHHVCPGNQMGSSGLVASAFLYLLSHYDSLLWVVTSFYMGTWN